MRVVLHCKPEMSHAALAGTFNYVLAAAEELHDRERQIRKFLRIRGVFMFQPFFERHSIRVIRETKATLRGEVHDALPFLWHADDASKRGGPAVLEKAGNHAVGGDHEVFDQLCRAVRSEE